MALTLPKLMDLGTDKKMLQSGKKECFKQTRRVVDRVKRLSTLEGIQSIIKSSDVSGNLFEEMHFILRTNK